MFFEIFKFELRQGLRKPATYIYAGILFALMLFIGLAVSGVLGAATRDTNIVGNSAVAVASVFTSVSGNILLGLVNNVLLVALMATAIQKDYEYNIHPLFFTKPISKASYFFGRFLGAFVLGTLAFLGLVAGYYVGCLPAMGTPLMGPFKLMNFLEPFLIFTLPNVLLLGSIFFSITTFTRSTLPAYLFCIVLLAIKAITTSITSDLENKELAAILEPFGGDALHLVTRYWTPDDQNTKSIPLTGALLYNRLLWLGVALLVTLVSYSRFSFSQFLTPFRLFRSRSKEAEPPRTDAHLQSLATLPRVAQEFSAAQNRRQLLYLARFEFLKMVKSPTFIIMCALGAVMMLVFSQYMGSIYNTETYPVTYQILESVSGIFQFFILIIVVFFSGTIIWREREKKTDELVGATPVSNTALFFSKYLGLIYVTAVLLGVIMFTGMLIQVAQSFYHVEPLQYIKELFGFRLISFVIIIGMCLAVQVFSPNKYLGFFLSLVPLLFVEIIFDRLEWNNDLYRFDSSGPSMPYSDMNGFGHIVGSYFLFKTYWLSIILVICLFALKFYARGKEKGLKARYRLSKGSFGTQYRLASLLLLLIAIGAGSFIYYNIKVLNNYTTPKHEEELTAAFEKKYKKYEKTPQLRIVENNLNVDIYPKERSVHVKGYYYLKNKHSFPVDSLLINYQSGEKTPFHHLSMKPSAAATMVFDDSLYGMRLFRLNQPVLPGDSIRFDFELVFLPKGFSNDNTETEVVYNGTFFNNSILPHIGYNSNAELSANAARKKYGLKPKPRMAPVNDSAARMNTYISNDADWVRFETTVSTDPGQIAVAPGYLQREWTEKDRRYFHYKMDSPILNFFAYLSADYRVKRDKWNDVNIEIYYQKGHEYNLDRMINSIKKSLDYYTASFGPYQHRQVRILEFPRYASFAQSFPNTIPFSEGIGFITREDSRKPDKIDVPFYVTAHEVAHQWWAHQVIGGNVQGSVLMSETMSQYSALMVMEKEYGKQSMRKFLKYEMDNYLRGRTQERKKEVPLMLCENQDYIHYRKGSVVMYSLRDYLGEDVLNGAIRAYLQKYKFQEPPFTNSIEFVRYLRAATPDSLKYIIKDMFETITIYENYVKDLSYTPLAGGQYKVKLTVGSAKFRSDSLGKNSKVPVADYIDVGVFGTQEANGNKTDKELVLQKVKIDKPEMTFEFTVNEKPVSAGIDPYNKLIDRTPDNNRWKFGSKPPKVSLDAQERNNNVTIKVGSDD